MTESPQKLDTAEFLKRDKENMAPGNHKDADDNPVRFHAANKEFYQIDNVGNWKVKGNETRIIKEHRFSSDPTYVSRECPVYVKAVKGTRHENWFAEYIKMATIQKAQGKANNTNSVEFFIAGYLGYTWGVQTLRTQVSQHKTKLQKKGVSQEALDKIPSLKVEMSKPRPTFVKSGSKASYTDEQVSEIRGLLRGL